MKIIDILKLCDFENVEKQIIFHYGNDDLDKYRNLYRKLKNIKIEKNLTTNSYIGITVRQKNEDGTDPAIEASNKNDENIYFDVNGFETDDELLHSIAALSYEEFLQYGIEEETLSRFSYESILAHSLCEVTSYGFDDNV